MREVGIFEDLENYYLEGILETPIGELAAEYDVPVECINDLFTLADEIDSCFKRKLLSSEELRNEEVSRYKVQSIYTTRYYFSRYIVLLGTYLYPYVDITITGNHGVSISDYGVEQIDTLMEQKLVKKKEGYTFADAIRENENRPDNVNIQYMIDNKDGLCFEEYTDDDEFEEYSDDFDDAVFK